MGSSPTLTSPRAGSRARSGRDKTARPLLVVDEFAWDRFDERTATWYLTQLDGPSSRPRVSTRLEEDTTACTAQDAADCVRPSSVNSSSPGAHTSTATRGAHRPDERTGTDRHRGHRPPRFPPSVDDFQGRAPLRSGAFGRLEGVSRVGRPERRGAPTSSLDIARYTTSLSTTAPIGMVTSFRPKGDRARGRGA